MLIKLPVNVHFGQLQVLAVNLNAFQRIIIHKIDNLFHLMLDLSLPTDFSDSDSLIENDPARTVVSISTYDTYEKALDAFQSMMSALESGSVLWSP